ncbi:MAG: MBL fold metallo-hydrolase, partial [Anaerolineae bacterium]|nr:MBL fold metallo-hydrolase [Anaerolineae bacterium]
MIQIVCLVDNAVKRSSTLWGEHGLSFWIETDAGVALLDTGQSGDVLLHNADNLGLDLARVNALLLSHAHYDHTGGLNAFLSRRPGVPLYAHPDIFTPRYSLRDGEHSIGMELSREDLARRADLRLTSAPAEMLPGVWSTGEIAERPYPEGRSKHHVVKGDSGWLPDPYRDDQSVVLNVASGLVVICGCCHAGLLNTLAHVRRVFGQKIVAIFGGTHLSAADRSSLKEVARVLEKEYGAPELYLN